LQARSLTVSLVTSIAFHPRDDRFFLAGSLDSILRLWSIPDKSVAFWSQLPDLITAVAFTPDGKTAIAGVLSGLCLFYETEGLKYHTQIHVRSSRGKNAKGSKITGIRTAIIPPDDPEGGDTKILITSNDSRVRLYNLRDKSLEMKFRGHENTCSQINASFSDDARYVICGSEDRKTYICKHFYIPDSTYLEQPISLVISVLNKDIHFNLSDTD
jgi:WD40 repeat protein